MAMTINGILKKRQDVMRQTPRGARIIRGSLVELKRACGKPNCRCLKGQKHMSLYLSQSYKGKTRMIYIPSRYAKIVRECVTRNKKLIKIVDELSELNIQIIKHREKI